MTQVSQDEYVVEAVIDQRRTGGKREFLVKWKDWTVDWNTWEPEQHVTDCLALKVYLEKSKVAQIEETKAEKKEKRRITHGGAALERIVSHYRNPKKNDGSLVLVVQMAGSDDGRLEEWSAAKLRKRGFTDDLIAYYEKNLIVRVSHSAS